MAVRKQRSTTKTDIINTDMSIVISFAKSKYRNVTDEFYIYEAYEGSGYYFADENRLNDDYKSHWVFNHNKNRWEND